MLQNITISKTNVIIDKLSCQSTNKENIYIYDRAPEVISPPSGMGFLPQEKLNVECRMSLG